MTTKRPDVQGVGQGLTIGQLARETGLTPPVLRAWESRHGFPRAERQAGGHRRYGADQVPLIRQVLRGKEAGLRLESAIAEALAAHAPASPSVFAALRRSHPHLRPARLRKSTLLALSHALEDECCAVAERPVLFGAFQQPAFWEASAARWTELARVARTTTVFADFDASDATGTGQLRLVPLAADAPMRREWVVVCDAPTQAACLSAWELPGQDTVPDRDRLFEAVWTIEPHAVRDAARACARVAADAGEPDAEALQDTLAHDPVTRSVDPVGATALFNRVVEYVDRLR